MCKYSYLSGACANRHIDSLECLGQDKCEFSGLNILSSRSPAPEGECGHEKWLGLYCEKYRRFFCPGKEHCTTPESYQKNLVAYQERRNRFGEER